MVDQGVIMRLKFVSWQVFKPVGCLDFTRDLFNNNQQGVIDTPMFTQELSIFLHYIVELSCLFNVESYYLALAWVNFLEVHALQCLSFFKCVFPLVRAPFDVKSVQRYIGHIEVRRDVLHQNYIKVGEVRALYCENTIDSNEKGLVVWIDDVVDVVIKYAQKMCLLLLL